MDYLYNFLCKVNDRSCFFPWLLLTLRFGILPVRVIQPIVITTCFGILPWVIQPIVITSYYSILPWVIQPLVITTCFRILVMRVIQSLVITTCLGKLVMNCPALGVITSHFGILLMRYLALNYNHLLSYSGHELSSPLGYYIPFCYSVDEVFSPWL